MTLIELSLEVRKRFPALAEMADRRNIENFGQLEPETTYSWFESLAYALNSEMSRGVDPAKHRQVFAFMAAAAVGPGDEVRRCIDVAFVENLFWQVPARKSEPYWDELPEALKSLYLDFHRRTPMN